MWRWLVVSVLVAGCGAGEIYNDNLTMLKARREIFHGLEVGMLRPEALVIARRTWPEIDCAPTAGGEQCGTTIMHGPWPGGIEVSFEEGRLRFAVFWPDSAAFTGVTPRALTARIAADGTRELVQRGDKYETYWGSVHHGSAIALLCDDLESVNGCAVMLGPWPVE